MMGGHTPEARQAVWARLQLEEAAPDLLAALKAAVDAHHNGSGRWLQMAYDAIEKAEGKPHTPPQQA